MTLLNETATGPFILSTGRLVPQHAFFRNGRYEKIRVESGSLLGKFTHHALFPDDPAKSPYVSPWWAFMHPRGSDPGVSKFLASLRARGTPLPPAVRNAYSVMLSWNDLIDSHNGLLRLQLIRTTNPLFAFYGVAAPISDCPPLFHPRPKDIVRYTGGATQLCIPNLTSKHFVGAGYALVN